MKSRYQTNKSTYRFSTRSRLHGQNSTFSPCLIQIPCGFPCWTNEHSGPWSIPPFLTTWIRKRPGTNPINYIDFIGFVWLDDERLAYLARALAQNHNHVSPSVCIVRETDIRFFFYFIIISCVSFTWKQTITRTATTKQISLKRRAYLKYRGSEWEVGIHTNHELLSGERHIQLTRQKSTSVQYLRCPRDLTANRGTECTGYHALFGRTEIYATARDCRPMVIFRIYP